MNNEIRPCDDDARDDDAGDISRRRRADEAHEIPVDAYASEEDGAGDAVGDGGVMIAAEKSSSIDDDDDDNDGKEDDHASGMREGQHRRPSYPPARTNENNNNGGPSSRRVMFFEPTTSTTARDRYQNHGNGNGGPPLLTFDAPTPGYYADPYHDGDHPSNYCNQYRFPYAASLQHHPHPPPLAYGSVVIGDGFPPPSLIPPPQLPLAFPLPPPPPPPPPPASSSANLDATRQYYEARMREHAMQYANAAAGAAWAAARIACGVGFDDDDDIGPGRPAMTMPHPSPSPLPPMLSTEDRRRMSYYTPAPPQSTTANADPIAMAAPWCHVGGGGGPRQKRMLWRHDDPASLGNNEGRFRQRKNKAQKATTSAAVAAAIPPPPPPPPTPLSQQEKVRSKKRENGGNDSISSLGSESRERLGIGRRGNDGVGGGDGDVARGKYACKKSNQRRRFNDEEQDACAKGDIEGDTANENRAVGLGVRKIDDGNHPCQKRGLHHGHSSKSSFSSLGSSTNNANDGNSRNRPSAARTNKKKKNRSQQHDMLKRPSSRQNLGNSLSLSAAPPSGALLGRLIGKNGVRALHELCSKYRWDMPTYSDNDNVKQNNVCNNDISFVLTVHVNGVELGRGRGGTKASAKQDASRKALSALIPGVVFDPNGILLDMGGSQPLLRGGSHVHVGGCGAPGGDDSQSRSNYAGSGPLSMDELGPHLASQLAIGGDGVVHGRLSPDHSETSSISTAISEEVFSGGPLISGGPLLLSNKLGSQQPSSSATLSSLNALKRILSSNIHPCASTTSGVSSASEVDDEDENAYYSSRGASVCSTLLHAMWQIDDRIWEPPSYSFDFRCSPGNLTESINSEDLLAAASGTACSKRKKVESPREVAGHRMFQCTATINLYFPKHLVGDCLSSIMDYWESPLDYLTSKVCNSPSSCDREESLQSRKRKDSFASQSAPSPIKDAVEVQDETPATPKKQEKGDFFQHTLENTGTGLTKRESKHKASAKLLAALFPACCSMVEVKAEAEATRELYAAKKEASQTKRPKIMFLPAEKNRSSERSEFPSAVPTKNDISLHALSLSEAMDGTKRIKWSDSTNVDSSFEVEMDAALQCLQELDEEGRWKTRDLSLDDVGKIVLRRACCDDSDQIYLLLNKNQTASAVLPPNQQCSNTKKDYDDDNEENSKCPGEEEDANPSSEMALSDRGRKGKNEERQLGDHSVILVLSRAVALHDPPLGFAILTVKDSTCERRSLSLDRLGYEEHLPRERFVESLETFAKNINCTLDTDNGDSRMDVTLHDIRSFLSRSSPPLYRPEDVVDCVKGGSSRQHLQSVKEEDSEEVDDGSDGGEDQDYTKSKVKKKRKAGEDGMM